MNLEQEFSEAVFLHKSAIVLGALLAFYKDEKDTGVNIPDFLEDTPEIKAKKHYYELLGDRDSFNETYQKCWDKYGALLP